MRTYLLFVFLLGLTLSFEVRPRNTEKDGNFRLGTTLSPDNDHLPEKSEWYPTYHLAPPTGWMNDPNGLIQFEGKFHFFYQHNPSAPYWGPMHWGHAVSDDMMGWDHLPIALAPSIDEDKDGCFSGSAVDNNGTLTLIYTGHSVLNDSTIRQVQCLATSRDTVRFEKKGPVLDIGRSDFRDPKVWSREGRWYMVAGTNRPCGDEENTPEYGLSQVLTGPDQDCKKGQVLIFETADLAKWEGVGDVLAEGEGYMWECPDFFELDGMHVLIVSPQGMHPSGYQNRNLYQSGYLIGNWSDHKFNVIQEFRELDLGHDFYAPQSFVTKDGRRVLVGWMAMWEEPMPEQGRGWATHLTLPRELGLGRGEDNTFRLTTTPIRESESWRVLPPIRTHNLSLQRESFQLACGATSFEILMQWDLSNSTAERFGFRIGSESRQDSDRRAILFVDSQSDRLVLDRRYPQYGISGYRSVPIPKGTSVLSVRMFVDRSSLEVFVAGTSMSSRIYPASDERCLSLFAENGRAELISAERWTLAKKQVEL